MTTNQARDNCALSVAEGFDRTPWDPPGLRFEVGDRVQIHLSGECRQGWEDDDFIPGHPAVIDRADGTIIDDPYDTVAPWADTHPYCVLFDEPKHAPVRKSEKQGLWNGGYFAVCELVLIDSDDALPDRKVW